MRKKETGDHPEDHRVHPAAPGFLLLHGDDDRIVTPAQTALLHRALVAAGADSTRYELAVAGHGQLSLTRRQADQWTSVQVPDHHHKLPRPAATELTMR
jgi:predicted esterase